MRERFDRCVARATFAALVAALAANSVVHAREYLVADQAGDRILAFDADSGAYKRTLWTSTAEEHVQPSAMTYGPGGDLYFSNLEGNQVLRIAKADLGGQNVAATAFIASTPHPGSLAYHPATNSLIVGEFGVWGGTLGRNIFVYNGSGALGATLDMGANVGVAGLSFGPDGALYASAFFSTGGGWGRIMKFGAPPTWQSLGALAPNPFPWVEYRGAANIVFDRQGDIIAAGLYTFNLGDIVKFDLEDGQVVGQQRLGDYIPYPSGLLMLEDGQLLVTSLGFGPTSGSLYRFNPANGARSVLLAGDFPDAGGSFNGIVDAADLARWTASFGADALGDADADGDSDGSDFLTWQRGLGYQTFGDVYSPSAFVVYDPPAATATPEPGAAIITGQLVVAAFAARLRRRTAATRCSREC